MVYSVYLVDDDSIILDELLNVIPWMDNGFKVVGSSTSPTVAMEEIQALEPTLVVLDLKMEPIDGFQIMQLLREAGQSCYFLLVSAYGTFANSRRFFLAGGFDYILKPIQSQEIQLALGRLYRQLGIDKAEEASFKGCNPAFIDLIAHLNNNYMKKHSLEALGKQFGLSPNYICNLFSKHYKTTLVHYVTALRMMEAKRQIEVRAKPLKAIAADCGYSDYYYFCRVFKDYFGVSPGKYGTEDG